MGMSENMKGAHRLVLEGVSKGDMSVVDDCLAAEYVDHALPPGMPANRDGFKMFLQAFRAAFPDFTYTIEDEMGEGDKVAHRLTGRGTLKGDFQGMKANGKTAQWQEMHIGRFNGSGKLVEHWATFDMLGMMTQLGYGPGQ